VIDAGLPRRLLGDAEPPRDGDAERRLFREEGLFERKPPPRPRLFDGDETRGSFTLIT
tara:strand:- start:1903 stop:2076 length:174 start_codon:yes stop_codon:yes gene_type:complete